MQSVSQIMRVSSLVRLLLLPLVKALLSTSLAAWSLLSNLPLPLLRWGKLAINGIRLYMIGCWYLMTQSSDPPIAQVFPLLVLARSLMIGARCGSLEVVVFLWGRCWWLLMILSSLFVGWICSTRGRSSSRPAVPVCRRSSYRSCAWSVVDCPLLMRTVIVELDILV